MKLRYIIAGLFVVSVVSAVAQAKTTVQTVSHRELVSTNVPIQTIPVAPVTQETLSFGLLRHEDRSLKLTGTKPEQTVQFSLRSDEVAFGASLNLIFTPSPALIPVESQLKIYLNDELVSLVTVTNEDLGHKNQLSVPLVPKLLTDYNRLRFEFIGHYQDVCENPAHTSLWMDLGSDSTVDLMVQRLIVDNDLSNFPEPFFDSRDNQAFELPFIFADQPSLATERSAAILASWFGSQAKWRAKTFPVYLNQLPQHHSVVFMTNQSRPDFLKDYPQAQGPEIIMMDQPENPVDKLLVISGRDELDIETAVRGIVFGNILFRGNQVSVEDAAAPVPRQPYDAPNWVRTDRPVLFSELQNYAGQLQANGVSVDPISISMNLPPDLFLLRKNGIDMDLKYRYTPPIRRDSSRLSVYLNNQYLQSYPLNPNDQEANTVMHLPIIQGLMNRGTQLTIPALKLGINNDLRFNFEYAQTLYGGSTDQCVTTQLLTNNVAVDEQSTIDFSGFRHFMVMPELRAFANASFPFSKMADLSETVVFVPSHPDKATLETMFATFGQIGSQTGLAAYNVTLTDQAEALIKADKDILVIGSLPKQISDKAKVALSLGQHADSIHLPLRDISQVSNLLDVQSEGKEQTQATVHGSAALAAIVGFESPYFAHRSILALLSDHDAGSQLLTNALNSSTDRANMFGSVAVVRSSGVTSLRVGDVYTVGYLPWWEQLWFALSDNPYLLAAFSAFSVIVVGWLLWRLMRFLAHRRLNVDR